MADSVDRDDPGLAGGPRDSRTGALLALALHLAARARGFRFELEDSAREVESYHDPRAAALLEAISRSIATPSASGTLTHVEQAATDLVKALRGSG